MRAAKILLRPTAPSSTNPRRDLNSYDLVCSGRTLVSFARETASKATTSKRGSRDDESR